MFSGHCRSTGSASCAGFRMGRTSSALRAIKNLSSGRPASTGIWIASKLDAPRALASSSIVLEDCGPKVTPTLLDLVTIHNSASCAWFGYRTTNIPRQILIGSDFHSAVGFCANQLIDDTIFQNIRTLQPAAAVGTNRNHLKLLFQNLFLVRRLSEIASSVQTTQELGMIKSFASRYQSCEKKLEPTRRRRP